MKIAFVTDSGIGKTAAEMAADGIVSLPLQISVDGRSLQDLSLIHICSCVEPTVIVWLKIHESPSESEL